jgi:hypothetical protein
MKFSFVCEKFLGMTKITRIGDLETGMFGFLSSPDRSGYPLERKYLPKQKIRKVMK